MSVAAKAGQKTVQVESSLNSLVNLSVLVVILLLLGFGCYAIWDSNWGQMVTPFKTTILTLAGLLMALMVTLIQKSQSNLRNHTLMSHKGDR